jgi:hypothetical protein
MTCASPNHMSTVNGHGLRMQGDAYITAFAKWLRSHEARLAQGNSLTLLRQREATPSWFAQSKALMLAIDLYHLVFLLIRFEEAGLPLGASLDIPFDAQLTRPLSLAGLLPSSQDTSDAKSFISASLSWFSTAEPKPATGMQVSADLKYLYSAFTKLPSLHLSPYPKSPFQKQIEGFDLPSDSPSMVPMYLFKNLSHLVRRPTLHLNALTQHFEGPRGLGSAHFPGVGCMGREPCVARSEELRHRRHSRAAGRPDPRQRAIAPDQADSEAAHFRAQAAR